MTRGVFAQSPKFMTTTGSKTIMATAEVLLLVLPVPPELCRLFFYCCGWKCLISGSFAKNCTTVLIFLHAHIYTHNTCKHTLTNTLFVSGKLYQCIICNSPCFLRHLRWICTQQPLSLWSVSCIVNYPLMCHHPVNIYWLKKAVGLIWSDYFNLLCDVDIKQERCAMSVGILPQIFISTLMIPIMFWMLQGQKFI